MLQAALPGMVGPEHLPQLPAWYPADPRPTEDDPHPSPYSPVGRAAARQQAAMREAMRGPYDGTRGAQLVVTSPAELLRFGDAGGWAYRLQLGESNTDVLVYRYSPADSPAHLATMRAVEQGYAEVDPQYVHQARTDQPESQGITVERTS